MGPRTRRGPGAGDWEMTTQGDFIASIGAHPLGDLCMWIVELRAEFCRSPGGVIVGVRWSSLEKHWEAYAHGAAPLTRHVAVRSALDAALVIIEPPKPKVAIPGVHCPRCGEPRQKVGRPQETGAATMTDPINRPAHYALHPEPIDVIEAWELGFHIGNVVKYLARAGKKEGASYAGDLRKAAWYLAREIEWADGKMRKP